MSKMSQVYIIAVEQEEAKHQVTYLGGEADRTVSLNLGIASLANNIIASQKGGQDERDSDNG